MYYDLVYSDKILFYSCGNQFDLFTFTIFISVSANEIDDNDDPQRSVACLAQFVYLPNVLRVEFGSTFDISRWKEVELILQYVDILLLKQNHAYVFLIGYDTRQEKRYFRYSKKKLEYRGSIIGVGVSLSPLNS